MTPPPRTLNAWLAIVRSYDDLGLAEYTLRILRHYQQGRRYQHEDVADVLGLITAVRQDEAGKTSP